MQNTSAGTRLLREPDVCRDRIAFVYAGDLWTAPRDGGTPSRLTRTPDAESRPRFSPQGRHIAFTRNGDVYVIPAGGGDERRLTWHPAPDLAIAWAPDGNRLLIRSDRLKGNLTRNPHLFLLPFEGGLPEPLPIPRALYGTFSPDGQQIAYGPNPELVLQLPWKRYRGGSLGYIAVSDLAGDRYWELPRTSANDVCPLWHKQSIYFLSDRDGIMNNNSGGGQADEIVNWIVRRPTRLMYNRHGRVPPWDYFLDGPKAMIVNDQSVSGGDELAYLFKQKKAGPLVGTRTFGGMIGSGAAYSITGGWELLVPEFGFYWLEPGTWSPENHGVQPDYVVELKPDALTAGLDAQLEKAIELMIGALTTYKKIPRRGPGPAR